MIGATLGVAVLGAIFAAHVGQNPLDPQGIVAGLHPALVGGAISELLGALAAWRWMPAAPCQLSRPLRPSLPLQAADEMKAVVRSNAVLSNPCISYGWFVEPRERESEPPWRFLD